MNIFICASKHCYGAIPEVKDQLEAAGHMVTLPNSFDNPMQEEDIKSMTPEKHQAWKADMLRLQVEKVASNDAILVMNMDKNDQKNYIGGSTFLEIFKAWELGKKIFLYNEIPEGMLKDELVGMGPVVLCGDLSKLK
jgi:hypothetical protein